ncbi:MAG: ABC transporter permease subunit [bacterium]
MEKIWYIASRELAAYFTTWMGYIIIALALIIDGLLFNAFALGNSAKLSSEVLESFFYYSSGMSMVAGILLAMRLMAEEKQNGTIVLLFSSPVTERQIIYGKFLSAFLFSMVLHAASLYMPALIMVHGKISVGHVISGYLCLALLGGLTASMTLFVSTLAPNQLVAAVGGAFIVVVFLVLWMLAKVVDQPLKDIFAWLAIHNDHFTPFGSGVVNLKDLVFYFGMIIFFLESSTMALTGRRCQG